MINVKKNKNKIIVTGMATTLAALSVFAYFQATDSASNIFKNVGEVDVDLQEPSWDPDDTEDITPNEEIAKDPQVSNDGENDEFIFVQVAVPKKTGIVTSNVATGEKNASGTVQLFQLNATAESDAAKAWSGTDTYNTDDWTLVASDTTATGYNYYLFAYAKDGAMTALAADATTSKLFNSVTFANVIEGQGLEGTENLTIKVDTYGIQAADLTKDDTTTPASVWSILATQGGDTTAATITGGTYSHVTSLAANGTDYQNAGKENNLTDSEEGE